jgi:DNA-binding NtrC family response regulator
MTITSPGKRILVIEDDKTLNAMISRQIRSMGHQPVAAHSWKSAQEALLEEAAALAVLDMRLPDREGLDALPELSAHCPVIVLTAFGTIDHAVRAVKAGAAEYLTKPVNPEQLEIAINRSLENQSLKQSYQFCKARLQAKAEGLMIGESAAFKELTAQIELVAPAATSVLVQGESGVGKELVAHCLHRLSPRSSRNIVPIDCCTLQENLFESELFGHERGAFTGAFARKTGLIDVADGGTLFLDEIGEISPAGQAKLLRVVETGHFRRLGGARDLSADIRLVAATNRDLQEMVNDGRFRADLYFRLAAFVIRVPPLRERREDVPLLARHFLGARDFARKTEKTLTAAALKTLASYDWPGNIRELRNVIERAILVSGPQRDITPEHLGLPQAGPLAPARETRLVFDHVPTLEDIEREYLALLLKEFGGRRSRIASIMGISERSTYRMLSKYNLMGK